MAEVAGLRRTGSAALDLAWMAAGRFDAYWERNIKPWDMAAGIVLVREAGGLVTDLEGGDTMFDSRSLHRRQQGDPEGIVAAAGALIRGRVVCRRRAQPLNVSASPVDGPIVARLRCQ